MKIDIKYNGDILHVENLNADIDKILTRKKHLCGSCQALVCDAGVHGLASSLIRTGVKGDRYYVFGCDGYKAMDSDYFSRMSPKSDESDLKKYGGTTYSIAHPTIRSHINKI